MPAQWWVAHMPATLRRDLGTAVTPDGYTFYLQPDATWSDGDMTFTSRSALVANTGATFIGTGDRS